MHTDDLWLALMDMLLNQFSPHHISLSTALPLSFGGGKKPKALTNKLDKT